MTKQKSKYFMIIKDLVHEHSLCMLLITVMLILLFIPKENGGLLKGFTLVTSLVTFAISLPLAFDDRFQSSAGMLYHEFAKWISIGDFFQMNYNVGVDGISLWLVLLTTFIMPIAVLSTWHAVEKNVKGFMALLLLL